MSIVTWWPKSTLLDRKPLGASSRTVSLPERLNRTLQRRLFFSSRKGRNPALPVAHANRPARPAGVAAHANRPVVEAAVDATGGLFGSDGPSTCRSSQSAVCKRCIAAPREGRALAVGPARGRTPGPPQGRCPTSYQWSWNKPLEANDAVRRLPTLPPIHHLPTHPRPCADLVTHVRPWLGRATACLGCVRCAAPRRCTSRAWRWWRSGGRATGLQSASLVQKVRRNLVDEEFVKEHFLTGTRRKTPLVDGNISTRAKSLTNQLLSGGFFHSKLLSDPPSKWLIAELLALGVEEADIVAIEEWRGRRGNGQVHRRTRKRVHVVARTRPKATHADAFYKHTRARARTSTQTFSNPASASLQDWRSRWQGLVLSKTQGIAIVAANLIAHAITGNALAVTRNALALEAVHEAIPNIQWQTGIAGGAVAYSRSYRKPVPRELVAQLQPVAYISGVWLLASVIVRKS